MISETSEGISKLGQLYATADMFMVLHSVSWAMRYLDGTSLQELTGKEEEKEEEREEEEGKGRCPICQNRSILRRESRSSIDSGRGRRRGSNRSVFFLPLEEDSVETNWSRFNRDDSYQANKITILRSLNQRKASEEDLLEKEDEKRLTEPVKIVVGDPADQSENEDISELAESSDLPEPTCRQNNIDIVTKIDKLAKLKVAQSGSKGLSHIQSMVNMNSFGDDIEKVEQQLEPVAMTGASSPTFHRTLSTSVLRINKRRSFWEKIVT